MFGLVIALPKRDYEQHLSQSNIEGNGASIEQGGPEAPPVLNADKVPEQLGMENLIGSVVDSQPEQTVSAEESKDEPEKPSGKIIDITGKTTQDHDTPDKAEKASELPAFDKDMRPKGEKGRRGFTPKKGKPDRRIKHPNPKTARRRLKNPIWQGVKHNETMCVVHK